MSRVRTKICGITRVEDALVAAEAGADAIGLVFYPPSPRSVGIDQAREICEALPAFVTKVGLFVDASEKELGQVLSGVPLDLLQFHGAESPEQCRQHRLPYMKALRMKPGADIESLAQQYHDAAAILLDTYRKGVPGGTGESFNWELIPQSMRAKVVLAGGLTPENVGQAIETVGPYAVDVSGGVESSPGIKDRNRVTMFVRAAMVAGQYGEK